MDEKILDKHLAILYKRGEHRRGKSFTERRDGRRRTFLERDQQLRIDKEERIQLTTDKEG